MRSDGPCPVVYDSAEECARQRVIISTLEELLAIQEQVAAKQSAELQSTVDLLHEMYKAMPEALTVVAPNGLISAVNDATLSLLGYKERELIGQPASVVFGSADSLNFAEVEARQQLLRMEKTYVSKMGAEIPVLFSAKMLRPTGSRVSPGVICIALDLRERKKLEIELRQAQKLEAIGQLAAGIAHEINTPSQYVGDNTAFLKESWASLVPLFDTMRQMRKAAGNGGLSQVILEEFDRRWEAADIEYLQAEVPKAIDQSLDGIQRVTKIVRAMKEFSHPGSEEKQAVDINKAIETTVTVARNEWKYVAEVETLLERNLPPVPCHAGEFNQVILNLLVNSAHAIEQVVGDGSKGKGKITIRTRRDGDGVEMSISDTGAGIPVEAQPRMFEPFFTTKPVGKGTGQGLALAHNTIVKQHGGKIWFETTPCKGTTFFIRLPLSGPTSEASC